MSLRHCPALLLLSGLGCGQGPTSPAPEAPGGWRGLVVAAEARCSPYERGDYYGSASSGQLQPMIVAAMGAGCVLRTRVNVSTR